MPGHNRNASTARPFSVGRFAYISVMEGLVFDDGRPFKFIAHVIKPRPGRPHGRLPQRRSGPQTSAEAAQSASAQVMGFFIGRRGRQPLLSIVAREPWGRSAASRPLHILGLVQQAPPTAGCGPQRLGSPLDARHSASGLCTGLRPFPSQSANPVSPYCLSTQSCRTLLASLCSR